MDLLRGVAYTCLRPPNSGVRGLLARHVGAGAGWSLAEGGRLRVRLAVGSADILLFFK